MNSSQIKDVKDVKDVKDSKDIIEKIEALTLPVVIGIVSIVMITMGILLIVKYNEKKNDTNINKQKKDYILILGICLLACPIIAAICFGIANISEALAQIFVPIGYVVFILIGLWSLLFGIIVYIDINKKPSNP
jgi:hypothetical protein